MATKNWSADFLDPALLTLKTHANRLILCSGEPVSYNDAADTYRLAHVDLVADDFVGPQNTTPNGRKITVAQHPGVTVAFSGTARYVALVDTINLKLRHVGRINDYPVVGGSVITIAPTVVEIADPY